MTNNYNNNNINFIQSDKYNRFCTRGHVCIFNHISLSSSQNEKCSRQKLYRNVPDKSCTEMFQTKVVQKFKTHVLCSITVSFFFFSSFFFENRAVYEITWKNTVRSDMPQIAIRRMRIACWIPKATNTHTEYVIFIVFPLKQWLQEWASSLHCLHC
jgi:hypothetical protein